MGLKCGFRKGGGGSVTHLSFISIILLLSSCAPEGLKQNTGLKSHAEKSKAFVSSTDDSNISSSSVTSTAGDQTQGSQGSSIKVPTLLLNEKSADLSVPSGSQVRIQWNGTGMKDCQVLPFGESQDKDWSGLKGDKETEGLTESTAVRLSCSYPDPKMNFGEKSEKILVINVKAANPQSSQKSQTSQTGVQQDHESKDEGQDTQGVAQVNPPADPVASPPPPVDTPPPPPVDTPPSPPAPEDPKILSFQVNGSSTPQVDSKAFSFTWTLQGQLTCSLKSPSKTLQDGITASGTSASPLSITSSQTFTLACQTQDGQALSQDLPVTIDSKSLPPNIVSFQANGSSTPTVGYEGFLFSWSFEGDLTCKINDGTTTLFDQITSSSGTTAKPTVIQSAKSYLLSCQGKDGSTILKSLAVTYQDPYGGMSQNPQKGLSPCLTAYKGNVYPGNFSLSLSLCEVTAENQALALPSVSLKRNNIWETKPQGKSFVNKGVKLGFLGTKNLFHCRGNVGTTQVYGYMVDGTTQCLVTLNGQSSTLSEGFDLLVTNTFQEFLKQTTDPVLQAMNQLYPNGYVSMTSGVGIPASSSDAFGRRYMENFYVGFGLDGNTLGLRNCNSPSFDPNRFSFTSPIKIKQKGTTNCLCYGLRYPVMSDIYGDSYIITPQIRACTTTDTNCLGIPPTCSDDASCRLISGLKGEFYSGKNFDTLQFQRIDQDFSSVWFGALTENFSARWTGAFVPKYSETYTFKTTSDDGVRLWVNNVLIIDNWTDHGSTPNTGTIALVANKSYSIKLEFYQGVGPSFLSFGWSSPAEGTTQTSKLVPVFP